jgi:hypothetical protein
LKKKEEEEEEEEEEEAVLRANSLPLAENREENQSGEGRFWEAQRTDEAGGGYHS